MAQIYGDVIINHRNRLQLKFREGFNTVIHLFKSILTPEVFLLEFSNALNRILFRKTLGKEKNIFSSFTRPPRDHVGVSGRLPMRI
jgi:hypothetical protein